MFHNRTLNSKINGLHERALRIVYDNYELSFDELLFIDNSYCSHHKNIQTLAIEMYKQKHGLSPEIVENVFVTCDEPDDFKCIRNRTVCYGDNSLRSFGPHVWKMLPESIKASETLAVFKDKVRQWRPSECSCHCLKSDVISSRKVGITTGSSSCYAYCDTANVPHVIHRWITSV